MTSEERKAAAEVMASDGPWQQRKSDGVWTDVSHPMWNWATSSYRVKPNPIVRWVNIYNPKDFGHWSREAADSGRLDDGRIACVRIEFTPGQFDE